MTMSMRIEDCTILFAECLTVRDAILTVIQKDILLIIVHCDSKAVVSPINGRSEMPQDIINLIEVCQMFVRSL